jgi:hypothetical protein
MRTRAERLLDVENAFEISLGLNFLIHSRRALSPLKLGKQVLTSLLHVLRCFILPSTSNQLFLA